MSFAMLNVPASCEIAGRLYDKADLHLLTQDMLEVFCPATNTLICVGWMPEEDVNGRYVIARYRDCERIGEVYRTDLFTEAKSVVERMARQHENSLVVYSIDVTGDGMASASHGVFAPNLMVNYYSKPMVEYA